MIKETPESLLPLEDLLSNLEQLNNREQKEIIDWITALNLQLDWFLRFYLPELDINEESKKNITKKIESFLKIRKPYRADVARGNEIIEIIFSLEPIQKIRDAKEEKKGLID